MQLIEFDTAMLAKKVGFDKCCVVGYYIDVQPITCRSEEYPGGSLNWNLDKFENKISAPYQSQLQKWLREEYDIDITIESIKTGNGKKYTTSNLPNISDTHEIALEIGLFESLKIIQMNIINKLLDKIVEYRKKRDDLTEEFETRIAQGKNVNVEFQKRRAHVDGELLAYKKSLEIIKSDK